MSRITILFCFFIFLFISCGQSNFEQALNFQNNGEYDKALEFYEKAILKKENAVQAEKNKGDIFFLQKDFKNAFVCYKNAIEKDSNMLTDRMFRLISDTNKDIRSAIKDEFSKIQNGDAREKILSYLSTMLKSDKQYEKLDALEFISFFGNSAKPIINDVLELIDDTNITVKQKVFEILPNIADIAIPAGATEKLFTLLKHPNDMVKSGAIECIGNMKQINDYVPLIEIAKSKPAMKKFVAETINKSNPPSREAVENIKKYIKDDDYQVRLLALSIFNKMENDIGLVVPEIILLSADSVTIVSKRAKSMLSNIKNADSSIVPSLIELLDNKNKDVKLEAIRWLANIGPSASDSIEKLQELAKDENKEIKSSAMLALKLIKK